MERPEPFDDVDKWDMSYALDTAVRSRIRSVCLYVEGTNDVELDPQRARRVRDWLTQAIAWMEDVE